MILKECLRTLFEKPLDGFVKRLSKWVIGENLEENPGGIVILENIYGDWWEFRENFSLNKIIFLREITEKNNGKILWRHFQKDLWKSTWGNITEIVEEACEGTFGVVSREIPSKTSERAPERLGCVTSEKFLWGISGIVPVLIPWITGVTPDPVISWEFENWC